MYQRKRCIILFLVWCSFTYGLRITFDVSATEVHRLKFGMWYRFVDPQTPWSLCQTLVCTSPLVHTCMQHIWDRCSMIHAATLGHMESCTHSSPQMTTLCLVEQAIAVLRFLLVRSDMTMTRWSSEQHLPGVQAGDLCSIWNRAAVGQIHPGDRQVEIHIFLELTCSNYDRKLPTSGWSQRLIKMHGAWWVILSCCRNTYAAAVAVPSPILIYKQVCRTVRNAAQ